MELVLAGIVIILVTLVLYARWYYGVLESMGVPVVPPSLLFGSLPDLHLRITHDEDMKHFKKYGPIYGVYEGRHPVLFVCDPELIKRITVDDFVYFKNRRQIDFGDEYFNEIFDFLKYDKWKIVRQQLLSAFSPAKINNMKIGMHNAITEMMETLDLKCGIDGRANIEVQEEIISYNLSFSFQNLYGRMSSFDNNFIRRALETALGQNASFGMLYSLSLTFPILTRFSPTYSSPYVDTMKKFVQHILSERRNSSNSGCRGDFLDKLNSLLSRIETEEYKKLKITEVTVFSQAMVLFFVSYEVLTATLVFLFYFLAQNPKIQQRLQDEIDSFFDTNESIEFYSMPQLPFLNACIKETLRLVPVQRRLERMCVKDYDYNGLKIKKGITVMVPLFPCQRNPQYFDKPDEFNPDRFMPENNSKVVPYACNMFGHGPRSCAGKRYAQEILRFSAARILQKFRFELRPDSQVRFKPGRLFMVHHYPIKLDIIQRCRKVATRLRGPKSSTAAPRNNTQIN